MHSESGSGLFCYISFVPAGGTWSLDSIESTNSVVGG